MKTSYCSRINNILGIAEMKSLMAIYSFLYSTNVSEKYTILVYTKLGHM